MEPEKFTYTRSATLLLLLHSWLVITKSSIFTWRQHSLLCRSAVVAIAKASVRLFGVNATVWYCVKTVQASIIKSSLSAHW